MKKGILLFALLSSTVAFGFPNIPIKTGKVKADLRCETNGGGIAIALPTAKEAAKIWQTDPGQSKGIILDVVSFSVARCPGCFSFKAKLMDMEFVGNIDNFDLVYKSVEKNGTQKELFRARCVSVKSK